MKDATRPGSDDKQPPELKKSLSISFLKSICAFLFIGYVASTALFVVTALFATNNLTLRSIWGGSEQLVLQMNVDKDELRALYLTSEESAAPFSVQDENARKLSPTEIHEHKLDRLRNPDGSLQVQVLTIQLSVNLLTAFVSFQGFKVLEESQKGRAFSDRNLLRLRLVGWSLVVFHFISAFATNAILNSFESQQGKATGTLIAHNISQSKMIWVGVLTLAFYAIARHGNQLQQDSELTI